MRSNTTRASTVRTITAAALGLACIAMLAQAGCYRRVVGAKGLGATQYEVAEPYQENSKLDDWIFGQRADDRHNPR